MKIERLYNHPNKMGDAVEMIYDEFVSKKENSKTFEEVQAQFADGDETTFPMRFIALKGEEIIGTVSLVENDLTVRPDFTPWLASLVVKSDYRSHGVGKQLLAETKKLAKSLGYKELYLRTETAAEYYKKNGWTHIETTSDDTFDEIHVFKVTIDEM